MLELIHLSLDFSVGSWTCGTLYYFLFVRQQLYLHMHFHIFNCLSYLILVFMIRIFVKKWSVSYGVFDSFTDRPYENALYLSLT